MVLDRSSLHYAIIESFINRGYPPTIDQLTSTFSRSRGRLKEALRDLADYHGVVLQPDSEEIWIAHPFSSAATGHIVRAGGREWWANCAWCSLGAVTLLDGTANIHTIVANTHHSSTIQIENYRLINSDYVVHFPVKMANAWDNIHYACSMMLFFPSENDVDIWCENHNVLKGDVRPIDQIWQFSQEWYGSHASPQWLKYTTEEAAKIFRKHGLDGPIWKLSYSDERF